MNKLNILIIDDDSIDRKRYRQLLSNNSEFQVEILEADNSKEGIKLWEENQIDCILLDYQLPDMVGIETLKLIKNKGYKTTPIIMLTGLGNEKIAVAAMKEGATDYIVKDEINAHILITAITNAINQLKLKKQLIMYRELEEQNRVAKKQYQLKNEFLRNMAHEFRTPLNSIMGFTELIHSETMGSVNQEQKTALGQVLTSAKELLQMINNAIEMSDLNDKVILVPTECNLFQLVNEVTDSLSILANQKKIKITSHIEKDISTVYIDPIQFKQVLYNYISNAIKFTPELGEVQVRIKSETADTFRLEVEDNGIGVKPQDIRKLFATFQQLDSSASKKYEGTGLGLSLTKHIVEMQGGKVGVTSSPGRGSIFYAILPR